MYVEVESLATSFLTPPFSLLRRQTSFSFLFHTKSTPPKKVHYFLLHQNPNTYNCKLPHSLTHFLSPHSSMANAKDPTTPSPAIGKIGPYTVFLTPPKQTPETPTSNIPEKTPKQFTVNNLPPPVQPPPANFEPVGDRFAFLWEAISKVQNVHASVDEYMANWLGLNQSKYQWALDDYYESKGMEKGDVLKKEVSSKSQTV